MCMDILLPFCLLRGKCLLYIIYSPNKWKHKTGGRMYGVVVLGGRGFVPSFILLKQGRNLASNMNALSV